MKNWEYSMFQIMKSCIQKDKYDAVELFKKLKTASAKYLENGDMKEGDFFIIPLELGSFFVQYFYKGYSTLDYINNNDKKKMQFVTKEQDKKEYYRSIEGYLFASASCDLGIGLCYNDAFVNFLKQLKKDDVFVCENNALFVCQYNRLNNVRLAKKEKFSSITDKISFNEKDFFNVNFEDNVGLQKAFIQMKNNENCSIGCRYFDKDLENLYPVQILLHSPFGKITAENKFFDMVIKNHIEELLYEKKYHEVVYFIGACCFQRGDTFFVTVSSFVEINEKITSILYKFQKIDDKVNLFKTTAENTELVNVDDFYLFCKKKYDNNCLFIKNDEYEKLFQNYPTYKNDILKRIEEIKHSVVFASNENHKDCFLEIAKE